MSLPAPSDRELDLLKVMWRLGEAKVRDIHEAVRQDGECAFTTVQTLLRIMSTKGLVKKRADGRTDFCLTRDGIEAFREQRARLAKLYGDRISVDGKKGAARHGEILEVIPSTLGEHYRVRWNDGHETDIRPAGGRTVRTKVPSSPLWSGVTVNEERTLPAARR